jgi:hypothetical protein
MYRLGTRKQNKVMAKGARGTFTFLHIFLIDHHAHPIIINRNRNQTAKKKIFGKSSTR